MFRLFIVVLFFIGWTHTHAQTKNQTDEQGKRHGYWELIDKEGVVRVSGNFEHGKPTGTLKHFYKTGVLKAEHTYLPNNQSKVVMYHETSQKMAQGAYNDTLRNGTWEFFDNRGIISAIEPYKNGVLDGAKVVFFLNGDTSSVHNYQNGLRHGMQRDFNEGHKLRYEANFIDGNPDGRVVYYHLNGKISTEGAYQDAVKHGVWKYYYENGMIQAQEQYNLGNVEKSIVYDESGKVISTTGVDSNSTEQAPNK